MNVKDKNEDKKSAAQAALKIAMEYPIIGVGTGSTVNIFIEELVKSKYRPKAAVASSIATEKLLKQNNINIIDLKSAGNLSLYIDGADSFNKFRQLIKGGGGALTREKILAHSSKNFICIVDESKQVDLLGKDFPVAVEVIPMAISYVAKEIIKLGGQPVYRENFITDNGNYILDIYNLKIMKPMDLEQKINNIAGVVSNGIFAVRAADKILVGANTSVNFY